MDTRRLVRTLLNNEVYRSSKKLPELPVKVQNGILSHAYLRETPEGNELYADLYDPDAAEAAARKPVKLGATMPVFDVTRKSGDTPHEQTELACRSNDEFDDTANTQD